MNQIENWCSYCGKFCKAHNTESHFQFKSEQKRKLVETAILWAKNNPEKKALNDKNYKSTPTAKALRKKSLAKHRIQINNRFNNGIKKSATWYVRSLLVFNHQINQPTNEQIENHRTRIQAHRSQRFFRSVAGSAALAK